MSQQEEEEEEEGKQFCVIDKFCYFRFQAVTKLFQREESQYIQNGG